MDDDLDLTSALGEWRSRPQPKGAPKPSGGAPKRSTPPAQPARREPKPSAPLARAERRLRVDWFHWLAYGVVAAFLLVQLLMMGWLDFHS